MRKKRIFVYNYLAIAQKICYKLGIKFHKNGNVIVNKHKNSHHI